MFDRTGRADPSRQAPFDVAVVTPTVLRPSLARAVESVYRQDFPGSIQILIGIDKPLGDPAILDDLRRDCPPHCDLMVFDPGYSTSARHGGLHAGYCGGALRTILSYAANSRAIAYLDDDNWFHPDHLRTLLLALRGHDYAFSLRWYVDRETSQPLCVDRWESVGPDLGVYRIRAGGFIDPSCLMLDKLCCDDVLRWWCHPLPGDPLATSEDRRVFARLLDHHLVQGTGRATCYYAIHPDDAMHQHRLRWIAEAAESPTDAAGDQPSTGPVEGLTLW